MLQRAIDTQLTRANENEQQILIDTGVVALENGAADQRELARAARAELDREAVDDIRQAHNQNQTIGNERSLAKTERMTGIRREAPGLRGQARVICRTPLPTPWKPRSSKR